jgi:hypothetical protein
MNRNSNTSVYRNEMQLNNNNKGTKYRDDDGYKNITSDKIKTIEAANIMKMNKNNTDINRQINTNIKPSNSNTNIINKKKPNNNNNSNRNKKSKKNVSDTQDV